MSKKHGKQKKKRGNFPWFLLVLGGMLILAAVFLLAGQGGGDTGTPSIAVDQQEFDFGDQKFGASLTFTVKVTNTGSGALRFKEGPYIEVLEGC